MDPDTEPRPDQLTVPRSRLIDQFYSHDFSGNNPSSLTGVRGFIRRQRKFKADVQVGTDLMRLAMKHLIAAYPEVSRQGLSSEFVHPPSENEGIPFPVLEGIKCPSRMMEASIAVVLEHTEHMPMNIGRDEMNSEAIVEEAVAPLLSSPVAEAEAEPET
jgi:hypothetical protein